MLDSPARDASAAAPIAPDTLIGDKYRVLRALGAGGMGVVVEARHEALGELVAIKLLHGNSARDPDAVARFLREARAVRSLRGAHAVRVHDVGTQADGRPYIVMERLVGSDLATLIEQRAPLPVDEAVDYVLQACEGLAEAHGLGIVHRDVKPSNLFLTEAPDGSPLVKVLDFGLAKAKSAEPSASLTQTGEVFGSPAYMPPEQIRSARSADTRSDVWSLGVVLFELVTGRLPFVGESSSAVIASITADTPPTVRSLRAEVPSELAAAIHACLEKSPSKRVSSIAELAERIAPFASPAGAHSVGRIRRLVTRTSAPKVMPPTPSSAFSAVATTVTAPIAERARPRAQRRALLVAGGVALVAAALVGARALRGDAPAPATTAQRAPSAPSGDPAPNASAGATTAIAATAAPSAPSAPTASASAAARTSTQAPPAAPRAPAPSAKRSAPERAAGTASAKPVTAPSASAVAPAADPIESEAARERK